MAQEHVSVDEYFVRVEENQIFSFFLSLTRAFLCCVNCCWPVNTQPQGGCLCIPHMAAGTVYGSSVYSQKALT